MVSAKDVQALNKKIESISQQRMKTETQQEMLKKRLTQEVAEYQQQFGVSLQGKTFTSTKKLIMDEAKKVTSEVEAEYILKEKVVNALESGDIDTAYALLGIEKAKPEVEVVEEVEETEDLGEVEEVDEIGELGDLEEVVATVEDSTEEEGIDFDFGVDDESPEESTETESEDEEIVEGIVFDDFGLDDESEEPEEPKRASAKPEMQSAKDAFADLMIDDTEESADPMDFGFGNMLNGTKFGN